MKNSKAIMNLSNSRSERNFAELGIEGMTVTK